VDRIADDEPSVRRLVVQFPNRGGLRACYQAGPTGYELARLLTSLGVRCQVIAPALIPKVPGDKTRDPDGQWRSPAPALRSRMASSQTAWRRWSASTSTALPTRSATKAW
jgi:hypothetical protein